MNTPNTSALDALLSEDEELSRLNVDIDKSTHAALRAYAKARKKTVSKVVRAMIELHLSSAQTVLQHSPEAL
ncbi:hypothetical protein [Paraburkholderia sp. SIMBA_027]|uniref:hypothetical protein n=1 Tax=Paraburkholderia sp. SIMBA_027 TaxID=3085770 RepID=UPI003978F722